MQPSPRTRFYLINLGLPLLLAALVFVLFDLTSLYGRPALQGLPALTPTPRPARLPALSGWHMASRVIDTRLMRFKHKGQQ
ncbi:hypothetical protein ACQJ0O_16850 [Pseudomonas shirazensis]|uniref:hypothetical protein n=1 Tax=Pseudomonas shirazensis TaxID=2745494 RepID=UPI003D06EA88